MSHLVPCPGCERHVRAHEEACPFCSVELDLANLPPPTLPGTRLSRAALFAFSATLAAGVATTGCSSDDDGGGKGGGGGSGAIAPAYGTPSGGSSGSTATGGASGSAGAAGMAGAAAALYGAAPGD
jgi:hypothetical protein